MISIIMCVFNTENYVSTAIESILNQTYSDFEFIIIDDASTDGSFNIIRNFGKKDPRIKIISNDTNLGISRSRNKGLAISKGDYIANVDSDDISFQDRLEKQLHFFLNNPDTLVLGGQVVHIDANGHQLNFQSNFPERVFRWDTLTSTIAVIHPTMMVKKEYIKEIGGYPDGRVNAIDRALFQQMALSQRFNVRNLSDVLVKYRIHASSTSISAHDLQVENSRMVRKEAIEEVLGRQTSMDEFIAVFEKDPGYVSPEISRRAFRMYEEFYLKFIKKFNPNNDERIYAKNRFLKKTYSGFKEFPKENLFLLLKLFFYEPSFVLNKMISWLLYLNNRKITK